MRCVKFIWCFVLLVLFEKTEYAQQIVYPENTQFRNFSVNNGLSQSTVNCIQQDSTGYLWFGTRAGGLNRFDGYTFKHFNRNTFGTGILASDEIICIAEVNNRDMFFGTEDAGIYQLDRDSNTLHHFYLQETARSMYFEKSRSILWIGTANGLVLKSVFLKSNKGGIRILENEIVTSVFKKSETEIMVTTNQNLYQFNPEAQITNKIGLTGLGSGIYSCVDNEGRIWLAGNQGLKMLSAQPTREEMFQFQFHHIPEFNDVIIRDIICDKNNNIWVGTNKGLLKYSEQENKISIYLKQTNNPNSLTHNSVYSLYVDNEGNLWIGTWSGISMLSDKLSKFEHVSHVNYLSNSLSNNMVSSFSENNAGLWIGTEQGGLNFFDYQTQSFRHYAYSGNDVPIPEDHIKCLYTDSHKDLWIGTFGAGIRKKERISGAEKTFLNHARVFALAEFPKDTLWVGTIDGLIKINLNGQIISQYNTDIIKSGSLHNNFITSLYTTHKGELWVGTRKGGAALYIPGIDDFNVFRNDHTPSGMASDYIICITEDNNGTVWIGTDYGMYYYDHTDSTMKKAEYLHELQNYVINGIVFDQNNHIWVSTNNGIFNYNPEIDQLHKFKLSDGMQSFEFNRGAYFLSQSGSIYFGGINGYNVIDPARFALNRNYPVPVIQMVKTMDATIHPEYSTEREITLSHKQNDLEITCVALSFINPEDNLYSYVLEGYNSNWSVPSKNRTITYTNLSPGTYTFKLKVSNNDNLWNKHIDSIKIRIKPPYWATTLAYIIYVIISALVIYFIRKGVLNRQKQKFQLEQERHQKKQIQELNDMKLRYFTNISHEFRTPLTLIKGPLADLEDRLPRDEETEGLLKIISGNTNRLLNLINQLLDFRKVEKDMIEPNITEGNLITFVSGIVADFEHRSKEQDLELTLHTEHIDSSVQTFFDPYILDKIIFNLLSNALKFTPAKGNIQLRLKVEDNTATLEVKDNGTGITPEELDKIFDRFYSSKNLMKHNFSGSGIGLALSKRLIEIHLGTIQVQSEVGTGTSFIITFPVNRDAYASLIKSSETQPFIRELSSEDVNILAKRSEAISKNHTLLIVEDNTDLRHYLQKIFKAHCRVITAEDGEKALELANNHDVDIIVSDIMMPKMDGIEMGKRLHGDIATSHIPIIYLTAKSGDENKSLGLETGAVDYIVKPFNPSDLIVKVNNILHNRSEMVKKLVSTANIDEKTEVLLGQDEKFLKLVFGAIHQNYPDPDFKVENLLDTVHLSRSQLYRKFKSLTGKTISDTLIEIRLTKARELLQTNALTISEVSFQTGYNNLSVFSAAFKKKFGVNPSEINSATAS